MPKEQMAEAIYAYLDSPGYVKQNFPAVAARVRQYVNTNPALRDVIQFNSAAPVAAPSGLGLLALGDADFR